MYDEDKKLSKEVFAEKIAPTIEKRKTLLKLLSMNLYDIEENSRMEELIEFKKVYGKAINTVRKCVNKFFKQMNKEEQDEFVFLFFSLMYGIYPYAEVTNKQKQAMEESNVPFMYLSIYKIAYRGILKLLN